MLKSVRIVLFFIFGTFIGYTCFLLISLLPLPNDHSFFQILGIQKPRIVAFLPYFLASRATGKYSPYITTLTYFGLTIGNDGHIIKLANQEQEDPPWHDLHTSLIQDKLQQAKKDNISLSLSVVQLDETNIAAIIANPQGHAQNLLTDIKPIMSRYGFTDLNVDIESFHDAKQSEVNQFTVFLQTLKNNLPKDTTITIDVAPIAFLRKTIIDPVSIGKIADYIFVMGYDFHTVLSSNTGPIAPLHGIGNENEYDVATTIAIAEKEINPKKIILGLPLYGYQWDSLTSTPSAATVPNTGQTASNRRLTEMLAVCASCSAKLDKLADEIDVVWQEKAGDPYFHHAFLLNEKSLSDRIKFAKINTLSGVGLWALGYEGKTLLQPLAAYKQTFSLW